MNEEKPAGEGGNGSNIQGPESFISILGKKETKIIVNIQTGSGDVFPLLETTASSIHSDIIKKCVGSTQKYKLASLLHQLCSDPQYTLFVKSLIETGITDLNIVDKNRKTPLHVAVLENCEEIVTLLLQNPRIKVNECDDEGKTPLHYSYNNEKLLKALLAHNELDVLQQDHIGKTILHYYCAIQTQPHTDIVELILKKCGKDKKILSMRDKDGNRPIDLADIRPDGCTQQIMANLEPIEDELDVLDNSDYEIVDSEPSISTDQHCTDCTVVDLVGPDLVGPDMGVAAEKPGKLQEFDRGKTFLKEMKNCFETGDDQRFSSLCDQFSELKMESFQDKTWFHYAIEFCYPHDVSCNIVRTMLIKEFETTGKYLHKITPFQCILTKYFKSIRSLNDSNSSRSKTKNSIRIYGKVCKLFLHHSNEDIGINNKDASGKTVLQQFLANTDCQSAKTLKLFKMILSRNDLQPNRNNDGASIIHYAMSYCKKKTFLKPLLNKYIELINAMDKNGKTPLYHAAERKVSVSVIEALLKVPGIDANIACNNKTTPLHMFCRGPYTKQIEMLLKVPNIDVNTTDNTGKTPLHVACNKSTVDVVKLLLHTSKSAFYVEDRNQKTPLHDSLNNESVLHYLISEKELSVDTVDANGKTILHHYCAQENCEQYIVDKLLQLYSHLRHIKDNDNRTASFYAHIANNKEVFDLVDTKASEMMSAAAVADISKVRTMLKEDEDALNVMDYETKYTVLHAAISSCCGRSSQLQNFHKELIQLILDNGKIDVNAQDFEGKTALHFIAGQDIPEPVSLYNLLLAASGIEFNVKCALGKTPLLYCVEHSKVKLLQELLNRSDVNIHCVDKKGRNLFHYVAMFSKTDDVFESIYEKVKSVEKQAQYLNTELSPMMRDKEGKTPLFYMAGNNYCSQHSVSNFLKLFSFEERDIMDTMENNHGTTALLHAIRCENRPVVQALLYYIRDWKYPLYVTDKMGRNILHYCLEHGTKEILWDVTEVLTMELYQKPWLSMKDKRGKTPLDVLNAGHLIFSLGALVDKKMIVKELDYGDMKFLGERLDCAEKWKSLCEKLNNLSELENCQFDEHKLSTIEYPKFTEVGRRIFDYICCCLTPKITTIAELKLVARKCNRGDLDNCLSNFMEEMKLSDLSLRQCEEVSYYLGKDDHTVDVKELLIHFNLSTKFNTLEKIYKSKISQTPTELIIEHLNQVAEHLPLEKFHSCLVEGECASILVDCLKERLKRELIRNQSFFSRDSPIGQKK